jgi:Mrp family chromosome partitioning ATPase
VLEAVEAQGVLERAYEPAPGPRARQTSSYLLGARYSVVPFRARVELDELRGWAVSGEEVDVAVLSGGGGVGKSRLARELCAELTQAGWVAAVRARS